MILETGWLNPTKQQIQIARKFGDESFTRSVSETEALHFSLDKFPTSSIIYDEWSQYVRTLVLLSMKNVEPHMDPYVGGANLTETDTFASLFWVLHAPKPVNLHAGPHSISMTAGSWAIFADTVRHSVISDSKWAGAATQVVVKIAEKQQRMIKVLSDMSATHFHNYKEPALNKSPYTDWR